MTQESFHIEPFFHEQSNTISYILYPTEGKEAAVIDPVLDFDHKSGRTGTQHADKILAYLNENNLSLEWILETHAHADHISSAPHIKSKAGGKISIGENICRVQEVFAKIFNDKDLIACKYDGKQFDKLFTDGETFKLGPLSIQYIHTPGHTPACGIYVVNQQAAFVGDTLFMPDAGTARCDFPGGSAHELHASITNKIFSLSDDTQLYMCHDYGPNGRDIAWETTVGKQKSRNIHVGQNKTEEEFVKLRTERDATLEMPLLIIPSVQVNIRAGTFPQASDNGIVYLKIPVNKL